MLAAIERNVVIKKNMRTRTIIDRYLIREVVHALLIVLAALMFIFITYSLSRFMVDADAGLLQPAEVANLAALKTVIALDVLLPLSLYLALLIALGRLYNDSEIYAMRASGVSEMHLLWPLMRMAVVLSVAVVVLSAWARPWAYTQSYAIRAAAEASAETGRIREARFYDFDEGRRTVFIEHIGNEGRDLEGVFVSTREDGDVEVVTASGGTFEYLVRPPYHRLALRDARVFKKVPGGSSLVGEFGELSLWLKAGDPRPPGYKVKSEATTALGQSADPVGRAEFQWRLSTPLSALLLAMAAIPLSRSKPRQGRFAKILLGITIYTVYFILLDVSRSWVEQGTSGNIWWVPALLSILVAVLYVPQTALKTRGRRAQA